ncbi:GNAT family N-acetyltransferase [Brucella intermedia]|uniref:GNAT family N-acetyltransferase n=1 Tax=Brucella TaxID=234 RepID=UPI0007C27386|nr:GNAT family N-acetyltransferase [Brucella intermedia]PJT22974.1 N-acetyltransferase [Ochrobactrum sp. 30A/1000/2015]PJT37836.1 N-acetyltransferase [Ochrobactrum sp. 27A/999/2015]PJT42682.1 N-acetyltransferase [Ochrobactrum sp. 23A/997/2015]KAB2712514.1 GNAT family N-acetyltransferase [Brucella intermedia]OAB82932.1 acetyltransferase [Brucella intermedia]
MAIRVSVETPLQDDVRVLVDGLNAHLLPLSPLEFQFKMTVEQMAGPDTSVFVARDENGKAVGCGALKMHGDGIAEVKRMFTLPEVRGKRVGSVLVDAIVDLARARSVTRLVLETGTGPGFAGAWRLYENSGFTRCGVVLDYPESEYSAFFEKRLTEAH